MKLYIVILLCLILVPISTHAHEVDCPDGHVDQHSHVFSGWVNECKPVEKAVCTIPGQVANDQGGCEWLVEPSFYNPNGQTLHCRTVHVFGEKEIYDADLRWNGYEFELEDVRLSKEQVDE